MYLTHFFIAIGNAMLKPQSMPEILERKTVAASRLFHIEQLSLRFSNGVERTYERLCGRSTYSVMIVPMLDNDRCLLIREYAAGINKYELALPKGLIDANEDFNITANRELQEEVGYAARKLDKLMTVSAAPGYFDSLMHIVLAQDLYPAKLIGDEPEDIAVVEWRLSQLPELIASGQISEARSIAALYMARDYFNANGQR
jgi:ADP-ribose diphosphatase